MIESFLWGAVASGFLLVGAVIAYVFSPGRRVIAVVMALGTGLLIGSVSFELVDEALTSSSVAEVGLLVLFGSVLDGIPESFVLGLTVLQGGVSVSLLTGISLSNLPEGMASSSGLRANGWPTLRVMLMWSAVVLASGFASLAGYIVLDSASPTVAAYAQAFAAGALLAMLADTLLPEAYAVEGILTGPLVVAGFATSIVLASV